MNAARCRIPPRERRWGVARTDRSGSAAGPCGRAPQERRGRSCRLGAPCSAPNQGCAERQWGTAIFSLGSLALSRVLGFVSCPWLRLVSLALPRFRRRCAALPDPLFPATRASRPGLHAAAAGAAGLRNRTIRSSDPMDRAVSVGRVRRTRPTVESKAASSRRTPGRGPRPARAIQSPPSSIEAEKMTPRAAVCGRVAGSSDPILRSHGSCGFRGPRPADAARCIGTIRYG